MLQIYTFGVSSSLYTALWDEIYRTDVICSDELEPSWLELKNFQLGSWPFSFQLGKKIGSKIDILIFLKLFSIFEKD